MVDESPRWLAQKGCSQEAKQVLQKAAAWNKSFLPSAAALDSIIQNLVDESDVGSGENKKSHTESLHLMFSNRPMVIITLIAPITWFFIAATSLKITLDVNIFGRNPFVYLGLVGFMGFLPFMFALMFSNRIRRVLTMSSTFLIVGFCSFLIIPLTEEYWWLKWILVMIINEMISIASMVNVTWASELYPTVVRSQGCGVCIFSAHLGFLAAPVINDFMAPRVWWLPNTLIGMSCIMTGVLVLLLPETKGLNLCETVRDIEERWKNANQKEKTDQFSLQGSYQRF